MAAPTHMVNAETTIQPHLRNERNSLDHTPRLKGRAYTITAGPPVVRPKRNSDGIPVIIEMIENDTLDDP
jgi:hypothetical protein